MKTPSKQRGHFTYGWLEKLVIAIILVVVFLTFGSAFYGLYHALAKAFGW